MTSLDKPVTRRSLHPHTRHQRRIIVTMGPGDVVGFRLERSRESDTAYLSVEQLFNQAETSRAKALCGESLAPCANPKKQRNL